jgi:hypothetical protein
MAQQNITIGTADAGNGDTLFAAFTKVEANFTELYSDDAGDVGSIIAGDGIAVDQATGDVTVSVADNGITHDKLEGRYTAKSPDIATTTGTINLDASLYTAFNLTGALGTVTLNVQNIKKGQVIDILLSGSLASAVITLADNFTTSTINKVGTTNLDTASTNIIQVLCVDDNDAGAILTYAVATYISNTTV